MSGLEWEDAILVRVAAAFVRRMELLIAEVLLASTTLEVEYGDSWWDGDDDYIYDVRLALTIEPGEFPVAMARSANLRSACAAVIGDFVDVYGARRQGDLVRFGLLEAPVDVRAGHVEQRRSAVREALGL